jgi:hypothetical protein
LCAHYPEQMSATQAPVTGHVPGGAGAAARGTSLSALALFRARLRREPLRAVLDMFGQYLQFAAAVCFALLLALTRVPLRWLDRGFGLRIRERCVDVIARVSPG